MNHKKIFFINKVQLLMIFLISGAFCSAKISASPLTPLTPNPSPTPFTLKSPTIIPSIRPTPPTVINNYFDRPNPFFAPQPTIRNVDYHTTTSTAADANLVAASLIFGGIVIVGFLVINNLLNKQESPWEMDSRFITTIQNTIQTFYKETRSPWACGIDENGNYLLKNNDFIGNTSSIIAQEYQAKDFLQDVNKNLETFLRTVINNGTVNSISQIVIGKYFKPFTIETLSTSKLFFNSAIAIYYDQTTNIFNNQNNFDEPFM